MAWATGNEGDTAIDMEGESVCDASLSTTSILCYDGAFHSLAYFYSNLWDFVGPTSQNQMYTS